MRGLSHSACQDVPSARPEGLWQGKPISQARLGGGCRSTPLRAFPEVREAEAMGLSPPPVCSQDSVTRVPLCLGRHRRPAARRI